MIQVLGNSRISFLRGLFVALYLRKHNFAGEMLFPQIYLVIGDDSVSRMGLFRGLLASLTAVEIESLTAEISALMIEVDDGFHLLPAELDRLR